MKMLECLSDYICNVSVQTRMSTFWCIYLPCCFFSCYKGQKSFKCDQCDKCFSSKYNLAQHSVVHTSKRSTFPCRSVNTAWHEIMFSLSNGRRFVCVLFAKTNYICEDVKRGLTIHCGDKMCGHIAVCARRHSCSPEHETSTSLRTMDS